MGFLRYFLLISFILSGCSIEGDYYRPRLPLGANPMKVEVTPNRPLPEIPETPPLIEPYPFNRAFFAVHSPRTIATLFEQNDFNCLGHNPNQPDQTHHYLTALRRYLSRLAENESHLKEKTHVFFFLETSNQIRKILDAYVEAVLAADIHMAKALEQEMIYTEIHKTGEDSIRRALPLIQGLMESSAYQEHGSKWIHFVPIDSWVTHRRLVKRALKKLGWNSKQIRQKLDELSLPIKLIDPNVHQDFVAAYRIKQELSLYADQKYKVFVYYSGLHCLKSKHYSLVHPGRTYKNKPLWYRLRTARRYRNKSFLSLGPPPAQLAQSASEQAENSDFSDYLFNEHIQDDHEFILYKPDFDQVISDYYSEAGRAFISLGHHQTYGDIRLQDLFDGIVLN